MTNCPFKTGKTYPLRDGGTAEILKVGLELSGRHSIVGIISPISGLPFPGAWNDKGEYYPGNIWDYDLLPPEPERVSLWMNVYPPNTDSLCRKYDSRDFADMCASENRTHVLELIYEDGVFVDVIKHKVGE